MTSVSSGCSTLSCLDCEHYIRQRVQSGATHNIISIELQQLYPGIRGLSSRSIRRFCCDRGIHYSCRCPSSQVEDLVEQSVSQVGPSYGRRTLTGFLRSHGIVIGEQQVRRAMLQSTPHYIAQRRQHTYRLLNPVPYYAEYFGHKIHIDQNEKLSAYGVTHVAASDGYSGKLLGIISMPMKNNLTIYDDLFRPITLQYGVWDQVRVDCGREFALLLFMQAHLAPFRTNTARRPYLQTPSTQNHLAERHWVEVNSRVNYPIKSALRRMEQNATIDMDCPTTKFCVSVMAGILSQVGLQHHIAAWNNHRIPGHHRGIPNQLAAENCRTGVVSPSVVPSLDSAVQAYVALGGHLSPPSTFGRDPLLNSPYLSVQRSHILDSRLPSPEELFGYTVNGYYEPFAASLAYFINVTNQLAAYV